MRGGGGVQAARGWEMKVCSATLGAARLCGSVPREATPGVQLSAVLWQSV
jgi:hypothetical protein